MAEGVVLGIEIGIEVVHNLALAFYIVQQVFITYRPGVQALMGRQFAERGGGVRDDRIYGADLIDGIEFCLIINGSLVGPVNIGNKGRVCLLKMEMLGGHPIGAVDGCGSTHTKDSMPTSFHN